MKRKAIMIKTHRQPTKQHGFTLIELMIVIGIIAVLATLGITNFSAATRKARDGVRKSDLSALSQAFVLYRSDNGQYPASNNGIVPTAGIVPTYIRAIPLDPFSNSTQTINYSYATDSVNNPHQFTLCAQLETPSGNFNLDTGAPSGNTCPAHGTTTQCTATVTGTSGGENANGTGCCQCVFSP